jgi:hypothetical protein
MGPGECIVNRHLALMTQSTDTACVWIHVFNFRCARTR